MSDVVPFGKYKGRPIEALAQDHQYVEWLTAQSWFRDRYQSIYNVVINNFQEPAETPEHNRLQVLFLGDTFRKRFLRFLFGADFESVSVQFEHEGFDVYLYASDKQNSRTCHVEIKPAISDDYPAILRQIKAAKDSKIGWYIHNPVLFVGCYTGVGATEEQFIAFFESEGIKIIFLDEVT